MTEENIPDTVHKLKVACYGRVLSELANLEDSFALEIVGTNAELDRAILEGSEARTVFLIHLSKYLEIDTTTLEDSLAKVRKDLAEQSLKGTETE